MSEWISVEDRLPEAKNGVSSESVLVVKDCGPGSIPSMDVAFAWADGHLLGGKRWNHLEDVGYRITHWMPLPAPPSNKT